MLIDDEYIDLSLSQKDTPIHQRVAVLPRPEIPMRPGMPKKTRLERLPLSDTTSAVMRVIRSARVERLPEYFEQTCDRRQHETAVICGSSQLTYQELDHRANHLAHLLISRGVGKGNPVGILLERSLDTYIALLGVLKAGAAFVPLDPLFPSDLVAFIAEDAGLRDFVTTSAFREKKQAVCTRTTRKMWLQVQMPESTGPHAFGLSSINHLAKDGFNAIASYGRDCYRPWLWTSAASYLNSYERFY